MCVCVCLCVCVLVNIKFLVTCMKILVTQKVEIELFFNL